MRSRIFSKSLIFSLVFLLLFTFSIVSVKASAADILPGLRFTNVEIESTGALEVIGHSDYGSGTEISFIMCPAECFDSTGHLKEVLDVSQIIYIDQVTAGNNGVFLIRGNVNKKWSGTKAMIASGSSKDEYAYKSVTIPNMSSDFDAIVSNSVLYGKDIFYIESTFYTPDNIASSIAYGGNNIFFKLGDYWYDLMDKDAVDNSFLVSGNACSDTEVTALKPRYYYSTMERIELEWGV